MEVYIFENKKELYEKLAKKYIDVINKNPKIKLGLATGSTTIPLYEALIKDHQINKTSYKDVSTFNLDEYIGLDERHEQSYITFMNEKLFDHIDIKRTNTYIPSGTAKDLKLEAKAYDELLNKNQIDILLLGIGTNAHIGFNEPGSKFDSETTIVQLTEETKESNSRFFSNVDEVPSLAITMGIASMLRAKKIILVATGSQKAEAIKNTIEGEVTTAVPASSLQTHPNVEVYLDKDAAKLLSKYQTT